MTGAAPNMPRVSLGLPVYNGENYLGEAIDCLLAQTFKDFELIISDNASTDATQQICEDYAAKDSRIRYFRQPENMGAAANYDFAFHQAQANYFRWCTHDDLVGKDFLEACVAHLDAHPEAVGALPRDVREIDAQGDMIKPIEIVFGSTSKNGAERFAAYAPISRSPQSHCMPFFSLYRRSALAQTNLHGDYPCSDLVLISEMLLHGEIALLDHSFSAFRRHEAQYSTIIMGSTLDYQVAWLKPKQAGRRVFRFFRYHLEMHRAIRRSPLTFRERLEAYRGLSKLAWTKRRELLKEALIPFFRNEKKTALGAFFFPPKKATKALESQQKVGADASLPQRSSS